MNSSHLSDAELAALPALPPAERLRAGDHLTACPDCRARRLALTPLDPGRRGAGSVFRDLMAATREEPAGVAAGDLIRLAELPRGRAEAEDLRAFQARLAEHPVESFGRGETLPAASLAELADEPASRRRVRWFPRLVVPLAAAALLLFALAPWSSRPSDPADRLDVALVDGPLQIGRDRQGPAGVEALPTDLQDAVRQAIAHGQLPGTVPVGVTRGNDPDVSPAPGAVAPAPDGTTLKLLEPASGATIAADRPTLRWTPPAAAAGVERQEVLLTSRLGGAAETRSGPLDATSPEWVPPTPLVRGNIYRWRVVALAADGREVARAPAGEGAGSSFKVLGEPAHERLELLRQHPAAGRSHLALGIAYAREGLHTEAAAEFRALLDHNPGNPLARDLLRSTERWAK